MPNEFDKGNTKNLVIECSSSTDEMRLSSDDTSHIILLMSKGAGKRAFEEKLENVERGIVQLSVLVLGISAAAKLLSEELSHFRDIFDPQEIYRALPVLGGSLIGAVGLATLISFFVFLLKKRAAKTSTLRQDVAKAFIRALEKSSFNPHHLEVANERNSPKTAE